MRRWTYNAQRRVVTAADALGAVTRMNYDAVGNLLGVTRKDGRTISFDYDLVNRVSGKRLPALPGVAADAITYSYDIMSQLTSVADNDSQVDTGSGR